MSCFQLFLLSHHGSQDCTHGPGAQAGLGITEEVSVVCPHLGVPGPVLRTEQTQGGPQRNPALAQMNAAADVITYCDYLHEKVI